MHSFVSNGGRYVGLGFSGHLKSLRGIELQDFVIKHVPEFSLERFEGGRIFMDGDFSKDDLRAKVSMDISQESFPMKPFRFYHFFYDCRRKYHDMRLFVVSENTTFFSYIVSELLARSIPGIRKKQFNPEEWELLRKDSLCFCEKYLNGRGTDL